MSNNASPALHTFNPFHGDVVDQANKIFGFDGWTSHVMESPRLLTEQSTDNTTGDNVISNVVGVTVTIRVKANGVERDGVGFAHYNSEHDEVNVLEAAVEQSYNNALLNAFKTFGPAFDQVASETNQQPTESQPEKMAPAETKPVPEPPKEPEAPKKPAPKESEPKEPEKPKDPPKPVPQPAEPPKQQSQSSQTPQKSEHEKKLDELYEAAKTAGFTKQQVKNGFFKKNGRPLAEATEEELGAAITTARQFAKQKAESG